MPKMTAMAWSSWMRRGVGEATAAHQAVEHEGLQNIRHRSCVRTGAWFWKAARQIRHNAKFFKVVAPGCHATVGSESVGRGGDCDGAARALKFKTGARFTRRVKRYQRL
jgi:hypothetical protein